MREFFCLEPDRADGRPLGGGRGAKVVFELSDTLAGLSRVPVPGEPLFTGYARAQLAEIPQVDSSSREFRNAVSVQVTLLRQFDDMVGHYGQLWDLSGDTIRLVFAGQVTAQGVGFGDTRFTLSDLPVDSINAQVPARIVEAENFPGTRDAGATVPVVIGRALRHRCPHLSSGYELLLERGVVGTVQGKPERWAANPITLPSGVIRPKGITAISPTTWLLIDDQTDKIYKTTDSGTNWDTGTTSPLLSGANPIDGIAAVSATEWLVVSRDLDRIYRTTDSGATWPSGNRIALPQSINDPRGVTAINATTWLVVDLQDRKVYKTTDSGATWDTGVALPSAATSPGGIAAISETVWLVVDGATDKVYRTVDSGANWDAGTALPSRATTPRGLAAISSSEWLVADDATNSIYHRLPAVVAVEGDTVLYFKHAHLDADVLKKYFPIAVGDRLSVGIGEVDSNDTPLTETVRVAAVTLPAAGPPSVTLEKPLANTHTVTPASGNTPAVDVVVVNHDVVRDYLLGEGIAEDPADSTREINFRRAYRAYHDGRALPFHEVAEAGVLLKFSATLGDRIARLAVDVSGSGLGGYGIHYSYYAEGVQLTDVPAGVSQVSTVNDKEYTVIAALKKTGSPTFYAILKVTSSPTDATVVYGQPIIQLPDSLQAPLDDWYRGFVVELTEDYAQDPETRALRVEDYRAEAGQGLPANVISLPTLSPTSKRFHYSKYSMREYRFFDGSQTVPYPGLAFMRFAVNYDGEIRADAQGFALERPQDFIREFLRNDTWGGKETGTFHLPAATDPQPPATVKLEMSLTSATNAYTILDQATRVRPFHLFRRPDGVHVTFPEGLTPSRYLLPARSLCASPSPSLEFMTQAERAARLAVKFRPDPLSGEFRGMLAETGTAAPKEIEMPYVYDAETARQCLWFERALRDSRQRVMRVAVPRGQWRAEDVIRESEPLLGKKAGFWRVIEAQERVGVVQSLVLGWLEDAGAGIFSWTPPDDNWPAAGWNRDIHVGAPATDWSKTPPPPVTAPELVLTSHNEDRSVCEISFDWQYSDPLDNVHGVQIEVAVDRGASVIAKEIHERTGRSGATTIEAVQCEHDAVVKILSTTLNNNLKGFPVLLDAPLAQRFIHVATSSSTLSSEPSVTSVSFNSGGTRTLYVKLPQKPTQNVTVRIAKTGAVVISKTTMTFTPQNWGTAQSVVLSGSTGSGTVTFTAVSSDSAYQGKTASVSVSIQSVYVPPPKLPRPENVRMYEILLYLYGGWDSVSNATSYLWELTYPSGLKYSSSGFANSWALELSPPEGKYTLRVKARAPGYRDSDWATATYTVS